MLNDTQILRLSQVPEERVTWLWPGHFAAGTLTLLDGDPGQGKSLLTLDLAARLSAGTAWPDGVALAGPGAVVLLNSEDALAPTIVPRLRAAGADLDRVHVFRARAAAGHDRLPVFPDDCPLLADVVRATAARLVIVDPFLAFLAPRVTCLSDQAVRQALTPLAELAAATGATVLLVRHLTKTVYGRRALTRGSGAMAIVGAARTAFLAAPHPDAPDRSLLACTKTNLAAPAATLAYRIAANADDVPRIAWEGPAAHDADDLIRQPRIYPSDAVVEAAAFLQDLLGPGPVAVSSVYRQARGHAITDRTLERAKSQLSVRSQARHEPDGRTVWYWSLPPDEDSERILEELLGVRPETASAPQ